jgi:hypothetical protein
MKALVIFVLFLPFITFSQDPFQRVFSGQQMASSNNSDKGVDGGYIFCKNTLVKTDESGNVEWAFNYRVNTAFQSIVKTFDSCYIATGNLYQTSGLKKVITIKVNTSGNLLWYKIYGGIDTEDEKSYSIYETNDSNYIIAGYTEKSGMDREIYLIKFDQNGDTIWTRTYGGFGYDAATNFIQTSDGGFAIIGTTTSYAPGGQADLMLFKTDAMGVFQWAKTFGGEYVEVGAEVIQLPDHGFLLIGYTQSFGSGGGLRCIGNLL